MKYFHLFMFKNMTTVVISLKNQLLAHTKHVYIRYSPLHVAEVDHYQQGVTLKTYFHI
jgi:hypothetical protein